MDHGTTRRVSLSRWLGLVGWIAASLAAGAVGGIASADAPGFYAALDRPAWAPPGWLFGPVWTVLYLLMGTAAWLVWREGGWARARTALGLFVGQLLVNGGWTWLFFVWRRGDLALLEIVLLLGLILATLAAFARVRPLAAALLLPYLAWVAFAAALTASLWLRNPTLL
jgi:tryptophan-rich sensory protein